MNFGKFSKKSGLRKPIEGKQIVVGSSTMMGQKPSDENGCTKLKLSSQSKVDYPLHDGRDIRLQKRYF